MTSSLIYLIVATLHLLAHLSHMDSTFLLSGMKLLAKMMLSSFEGEDIFKDTLIDSIPSDVRTVVDEMNIEPETEAFVCCPKCYCTYSMDDYPPNCTNRPIPGGEVCRRSLRKFKDNDIAVPIRTFLCQNVRQWLARMYARPDIEEILDRNPYEHDREDNVMDDIWDGSVLKEFLGPDGKSFIRDDLGSESRLVFGLNQDGLNPYGNRIAGKSVSVGPIYLVCLNLPPDLRYRVENICLVGVIPGPREPQTDQMNHLLRPLVNTLLEAWNDGFYLSKTRNYPSGRLVRCALVPIIADLPATRQLTGISGHSSDHWCSMCDLSAQDSENLEPASWPRHTREEHMGAAAAWKDSATAEEREEHWQKDRVRWSELLRLPYWDPTKFVTLDSMHGFYLGLFQRHIRDIWGMDIHLEEGDELSANPLWPPPTEIQLSDAKARLGDGKDMATVKIGVLVQLCRDHQVRYAGTKKQLIRRLRPIVCSSHSHGITLSKLSFL